MNQSHARRHDRYLESREANKLWFRNSIKFDFLPHRCHCAYRSGRKDFAQVV